MKVSRITSEEREEISRQLAQGLSISKIAEQLERNKSSISREVRRAGMTKSTYRALKANRVSIKSRKLAGRKCKLDEDTKLRSTVLEWLQLKWSPEQIMQRLKIEYPLDPTMRISTETIYRYLYVHPRQTLRKELISQLRRQHKARRKRKGKDYQETRGRIANMVSIDERPSEVEGRQVPGHWEGDLILGKEKKSAMGTLSERSTRFTVLARITEPGYTAESARKAFAKAFKKIPRSLKKSLTYDQGREMKEHELFTKETNIQVYFAHARSPWERGTNENTNSLVRQYFRSNRDLSTVSESELRKVQAELNDRPRKCLGFKTPNEVFSTLLQS